MGMREKMPVGTDQEKKGLQRPYKSQSPAPKFTYGETEGSDLGLVTQIFPSEVQLKPWRGGPRQ